MICSLATDGFCGLLMVIGFSAVINGGRYSDRLLTNNQSHCAPLITINMGQ